jgi:hypothetical protein
MKVGDIVFSKCQYSDKPVMFSGPILVTKVRKNHIDICYLNNPHTNAPQGLGHAYKKDFIRVDEVPEDLRGILSLWVTRAICSDDPNLTMTYEAGQAVGLELKRLEVV